MNFLRNTASLVSMLLDELFRAATEPASTVR